MKKTLKVFLLLILLTASACTPLTTAIPATREATETSAPTPPSATQPAAPAATSIPSVAVPTATAEPAELNTYSNSAFGFGFQYPANWFGPDEYISDQTLRLAIGSDVVYPYGEPPEQPSEVTNSYSVVIQYTQNNPNPLPEIYQTLLSLKDGESLSGARGLTIRVRQLEIGRFKGFEFISTLSETAQTSAFYAREVLLVDEKSNLITIFGTPNNVEIGDGSEWRAIYQRIDEANLAFFHQIVESLTVE